MTDWGQLYRDHVAAVSALAEHLTPEQLGTTVPGSPEWTVRDVLGHMAGVASDSVTGRMDGAPSPGWTQRAVDERAEDDVPDLLAELGEHEDAVAASVEGNDRPAVVWDIAVHHADLHEALGKGRLPDRLYLPVVDALTPMAGPDVAEAVPPYELFRGLFSRRSRGQMQAWDVAADQERLDGMCIFGPRDDDQPIP